MAETSEDRTPVLADILPVRVSSKRVLVEVAPSNTNHRLTVRGPAIQLRRGRRTAGTCREAIIAVLSAQGVEPVQTATDVHAALAAAGGTWSKQTAYKALYRMTNEGILIRRGSGFVLVTSPRTQ